MPSTDTDVDVVNPHRLFLLDKAWIQIQNMANIRLKEQDFRATNLPATTAIFRIGDLTLNVEKKSGLNANPLYRVLMTDREHDLQHEWPHQVRHNIIWLNKPQLQNLEEAYKNVYSGWTTAYGSTLVMLIVIPSWSDRASLLAALKDEEMPNRGNGEMAKGEEAETKPACTAGKTLPDEAAAWEVFDDMAKLALEQANLE